MAWSDNKGKRSDRDVEDSYEINPTIYANKIINSIIEAPIKALEGSKPFDEGLYAYTIGVDTLELLCRANKWVGWEGDDYDQVVREKLLALKPELEAERVLVRRDAKISKIRFGLLLERILLTRIREGPLKVV